MSLLTACVSHWKLDETSNTAARVDDQGANNLAANDFPSSAAGLLGNALTQTGSGTDYLANLAATGVPAGLNPVSLSAWVNATSLAAYRTLIEARTADAQGVITLGCGDVFGSQRFFMQIYDGLGHNQHVTADAFGVPATGTWYHVVGTFDPGLGSNQLKIYVNGSFDTAANYSFGLPAAAVKLGVGCPPLNPTDPNGRWAGLLDEAAVFNAALSAADVTALYNGGSPLPFSSYGGSTPGGAAAPFFRGISTGGGLSPRGVVAGGGL